MRHFPLILRLQRLLLCSKTAELIRWQEEELAKDGKMRHSADGEAWKSFDGLHEIFFVDLRNVRLGLASDGFNPFRTMSISHSTWLVMIQKLKELWEYKPMMLQKMRQFKCMQLFYGQLVTTPGIVCCLVGAQKED